MQKELFFPHKSLDGQTSAHCEETMAARKNINSSIGTTVPAEFASENPGDTKAIKIPPLSIIKTTVRVRGIEPVITHRFSEKAKKQMLDKKQGRARAKKEACDPEAEFLAARYVNKDGKDCLPSLAFKCAIVDAASFVEGVTKVAVRGAVFIPGEFVEIHYEERLMREDVVRVGMGAADLRYRPEYRNWYVDLPVHFTPNVISAEQLHHLIQLAGFSVGVCEWRPQRDGQFGRFEIVNMDDKTAAE